MYVYFNHYNKKQQKGMNAILKIRLPCGGH